MTFCSIQVLAAGQPRANSMILRHVLKRKNQNRRDEKGITLDYGRGSEVIRRKLIAVVTAQRAN